MNGMHAEADEAEQNMKGDQTVALMSDAADVTEGAISWNIVHDADDDEGKPTTWSAQVDSDEYGKYVWIEKSENGYDVVINNNHDDMVVFRSFDALDEAQNYVEEEMFTNEASLTTFVREQNQRMVDSLEVGDQIGVAGNIYEVTEIDGDFLLALHNQNPDAESTDREIIGNWKEGLLEEAGNEPISVIKAEVIRQLAEADGAKMAETSSESEVATSSNLSEVSKALKVGENIRPEQSNVQQETENPIFSPEELEKQAQNAAEQQKFASDFHALLAGDRTLASKPLVIGTTPNVLTICGADGKLNLTITKKVIDKAMRPEIRDENGRLTGKTGHGLTEQQILDALQNARNPIMVLKGGHGNSLLIVTEVLDKHGRNIVIPIDLSTTSAVCEVNAVRSTYGRDNLQTFLDNAFADGTVLAVDMKKADQMNLSSGKWYPEAISFICFDNSIAYSLKNVKYPEQEMLSEKGNPEPTNPEKVDTSSNSEPITESNTKQQPELVEKEKKRGRLTRPEELYKLLSEMYPQIISGERTHEHYEADADSGYEPLSVEMIGDDLYSFMTYYIQNGDLMRDPDITFMLDHEEKTAHVFSFQQDGVPPHGTYYVEVADENGRVDTKLQASLERTFLQNLKNAQAADRTLTRYHDRIGEEVVLVPDIDNAPETEEPTEPIKADANAHLREVLNAFSEEYGLGELNLQFTDAHHVGIFETYADGSDIMLGVQGFWSDNEQISPEECKEILAGFAADEKRRGRRVEDAMSRKYTVAARGKSELPPVPDDLPEIIYAKGA